MSVIKSANSMHSTYSLNEIHKFIRSHLEQALPDYSNRLLNEISVVLIYIEGLGSANSLGVKYWRRSKRDT